MPSDTSSVSPLQLITPVLLSYEIGALALINVLVVASLGALIVIVLPVMPVVTFVPPAIVIVSEFVLLTNVPESELNVLTML